MLLSILTAFFHPFFVYAQHHLDTLHTLPEVEVLGKNYRAVIPSQKLGVQELKMLNSFSVADAIRYFSGVQIKDYGGVGGLKTVNMRSLGTNHVGVFYDGIQLGNAQNGQIDLGKFSLDNIDEIALYNGQKSEIFQPARDFGTSGSIYLRSRTPYFRGTDLKHVKAGVKVGSFGLLNPSFLYEQKINDKMSASVNGEYIKASGKYPFRYRRIHPQTKQVLFDTTAVRENGDIRSLRVEAGLYGMGINTNWKLKTYFYDSQRGIPGAVINNKWANIQRQWDRNFFVQGSLFHTLIPGWDIQINSKYANDYMRYLNPDTTLMLLDNVFRQQELYTSFSSKYSLTSWWDCSIATDIQYNTLSSNMSGFVYPERWTTLVALATAIEKQAFKGQASLLSTHISEKTRLQTAAPNKREFTPAVFLSLQPLRRQPFHLRTFYKQIFRMPTFNDLYYTDIGNIDLKPEFTSQYNMGFQYDKKQKNHWLKAWSIQADAYYNEVTNKIVAVPKGSGQYRWMMMNIGKVKIRGIDFIASAQMQFYQQMLLQLKTTYTYQRAQDFTSRKSGILTHSTYGGQIPYIPWHSGSLVCALSYKTWHVNYSFLYVGERYHSAANIPSEYEQPWYTSDVSLIKNMIYRNMNIRISLEVNNILNQDYEVVLNYPMPGRNYKLSFAVDI